MVFTPSQLNELNEKKKSSFANFQVRVVYCQDWANPHVFQLDYEWIFNTHKIPFLEIRIFLLHLSHLPQIAICRSKFFCPSAITSSESKIFVAGLTANNIFFGMCLGLKESKWPLTTIILNLKAFCIFIRTLQSFSVPFQSNSIPTIKSEDSPAVLQLEESISVIEIEAPIRFEVLYF